MTDLRDSVVQNKCEKKNENNGWFSALNHQLEHLEKRTTWLAILIGQVMSALLCISAFTTVHLVEVYKVRIPNDQNFSFYIILATVFTTILACRPAERNLFSIIRSRGWKYIFLAIIDAESKYLVNKSFQFTSLTSVQLLDCFSIPVVLSLSWLVLKIRFKVPHILGVSICMLGVSCLVWADIEEGIPSSGSIRDRFMGDMLCLAGAFLIGISNIAQELVVKTFDPVEFLGMIGLFGSFVSGAQTIMSFELRMYNRWHILQCLGTQPIVLIGMYAGTQVVFYVLSTFVIKWSSATLLNLGLLSADFYTLIVAIYFLRVRFHALYFLSYVLVMAGVITFSVKPTILGSHIYASLTREITTTLDLELMNSSPSATEFSTEPNNQYYYYDTQNDVNVGGVGSLLYTKQPSQINKCNSRKAMLSNASCDVVLQTTETMGKDRRNGALRRKEGRQTKESTAEEDGC